MPVDYPSAVARQSADRRDAWFQSHVTTVLQRDVRDLASVADTTAFRGCFSVVAVRVDELLNFADLSRTMALPQKTLKR
jgi:predicted AAA+ superfamily ATPase